MTIVQTIYLLATTINIIYLTGLSLFLLRKWNTPVFSQEEHNIREIKRAVGSLVLICAISYFVFLLPILIRGWEGDFSWDYAFCFFLIVLPANPILHWTFHAFLQNTANMMRGFYLTFPLEIVIFIWFLISPHPELQTNIVSVIILVSLSITLCDYYIAYRRLNRQLRSEYSYLTNRDLRWTLQICNAMGIGVLQFILDEYIQQLWFDIICSIIFLIAVTYLVYSANKCVAISTLINNDKLIRDQLQSPLSKEQIDDITIRLYRHCEAAELYLDPELTCASLSEKIGCERNMLIRYFNQRHINYFIYINNLRIDYACNLMDEENEDVVIRDIARRSGFNSTRAFIDAYKEVMDYIPEEEDDEDDSNKTTSIAN